MEYTVSDTGLKEIRLSEEELENIRRGTDEILETLAPELTNIRLREENELREILRNVAVILTTPKGSVPMYRTFGLDMSFLDKPMNVAKNMAVIPVREAIEEWEPRAEYKDMTLMPDPSNPGKLTFTVQIKIKAGETP